MGFARGPTHGHLRLVSISRLPIGDSGRKDGSTSFVTTSGRPPGIPFGPGWNIVGPWALREVALQKGRVTHSFALYLQTAAYMIWASTTYTIRDFYALRPLHFSLRNLGTAPHCFVRSAILTTAYRSGCSGRNSSLYDSCSPTPITTNALRCRRCDRASLPGASAHREGECRSDSHDWWRLVPVYCGRCGTEAGRSVVCHRRKDGHFRRAATAVI